MLGLKAAYAQGYTLRLWIAGLQVGRCLIVALESERVVSGGLRICDE